MKKVSLLLTVCSLSFVHASHYDKENMSALVNVWPGTPRPHLDLKERSSRRLQPETQKDLTEGINEALNKQDKAAFEDLIIKNKPQKIFLTRLVKAMHAEGITENYNSMLNNFIDIYKGMKNGEDIKIVLQRALKKYPILKGQLKKSNFKVQSIMAEELLIDRIVEQGAKTCIKKNLCSYDTEQGTREGLRNREIKRKLFPAAIKHQESHITQNGNVVPQFPVEDEKKPSQPLPEEVKEHVGKQDDPQVLVAANKVEEKKEQFLAANKAKLGVAALVSLCCSCWWVKKNDKKIEACKQKERVVHESKEIIIQTHTA